MSDLIKQVNVSKGYNINFFELMFLAESVVGQKTIGRVSCFKDFSERHFHNMSWEERKQFRMHVVNSNNFDHNNEDCQRFKARFDFSQNYMVHLKNENREEVVEAYLFSGKYWTSERSFCAPEYIVKAIKLSEIKK